MMKLTSEDARILVKRIKKILWKAKYTPHLVADLDAAAFEIVRPYVQKEQRNGLDKRDAAEVD